MVESVKCCIIWDRFDVCPASLLITYSWPAVNHQLLLFITCFFCQMSNWWKSNILNPSHPQQEKCAQYWPTAEEKEMAFRDTCFLVTLMSEDVKSYYTTRVLELQNMSVCLIISQTESKIVQWLHSQMLSYSLRLLNMHITWIKRESMWNVCLV